MFSRGYDEIRNKISKGSKYLRSCQNCRFYSKEIGDKEEVCQNTDVLQYDIVNTENSIYCLKWQPYEFKSVNSIFKRGGKSVKIKKKDSKGTQSKTGKQSRKRS